MEKRWLALVALSAAAATAFVGCSCGNRVDNSIGESNQIEVQSDVTVSSEITTTVTTAAETETSETSAETTTAETTETGETGTTVSRRVQFVGQAGGRATTAARPVVVTVIVTVTKAPATNPPVQTTATTTTTVPVTEEPVVTTTTLVTVNMPDGLFTPSQDLCFTVESSSMTVGGIQPALSALAEQVTNGTPVNGGSAAYIYSCDGYQVNTEVMAMADGSTQEQITEILLTGDNVCTNKGIRKGSSIDDIFAAYGNADCEIVDTYIYRYKTEDGYVMDFHTDGYSVSQVRYYKAVL